MVMIVGATRCLAGVLPFPLIPFLYLLNLWVCVNYGFLHFYFNFPNTLKLLINLTLCHYPWHSPERNSLRTMNTYG
jgi:hypothetical protein